MALQIMIVKDVSIPYWEQEETITFGEIDPVEFGSLFRKDFGIKSVFEYTSEGRDRQTYDDYYSKQISSIAEKFPLITRIKDYYEDAFFSRNEINALRQEIVSLKNVVERQETVNFLDQLLEGSEMALKNDAGLQLVAD